MEKKSLYKQAAVLIIICIGICLVQFYISPTGIYDALRFCKSQLILIPLNGFPVLVLTAVLWLLFNNVFAAGAVSSFFFFVFSYVNLLKIEGRDDPLVPADVMLVREALGAAADYDLDMHWDKVAVFSAVIVLFILLAVFFGKKKKIIKFKPAAKIVITAILVLSFAVSYAKVYRSKNLYDHLEVDDMYNITAVYNTLGLNYSFLYNCNLYPVDKPEGFNKAKMESLDGADVPVDAAVSPNVLFVMCEAFSDLPDEDAFSYTEENNPISAFHKVVNDPLSISGYINVPNYAAGTANTEFDVVTGMQTNMVGEGTTSSFRTVRSSTRSLATVLESNGYDTLFMHPGDSWFYNRSSVYRYLGIKDQVFNDSFSEKDFKGQFISDSAFLDKLKECLGNLEEKDKPLFSYSVTIENHQSYSYLKYPEMEYPKLMLSDGVGIDDDARENLEVYFEGLKDSSEMIFGLSEYIDSIDEPVLLVFFGDHRANLGSTYGQLGIDYDAMTGERRLEKYNVPFVIKANRAYAKSVDISNVFEKSGLAGSVISSNYLGAAVLDLIGFGETDNYFAMLNEMRKNIPVYRPKEDLYITDGFASELGPDEAAMVEDMHNRMYYRLKY